MLRLLAKLGEMLKKPTIETELSQTLKEFVRTLDNLEQSQNENKVNFAQVAIFLEGSANLYSKKVDLLWEYILDYQKRMISRENKEEKEVELEKLEERKRKYKRRRKSIVNTNQNKSADDKFDFGQQNNAIVDYAKQQMDNISSLNDAWKKFDSAAQSNATQPKDVWQSAHFHNNMSIYTEEMDYIGRYNQFSSLSCLSHIPSNNNLANVSANNNNNILKELNTSSFSEPNETFPPTLQKESDMLDPNDSKLKRRSFVSLPRLSEEIVSAKLRRMSMADSLFSNADTIVSQQPSQNNTSIGQESGFCDDFMTTFSSHVTIIPSLKRSITKRDENSVRNKVGKRQKTQSPRKLSAKLVAKLTQPLLSVNLNDFELFANSHYKPSDGENALVANIQPTSTDHHDDAEVNHDDCSNMDVDFFENVLITSTPISSKRNKQQLLCGENDPKNATAIITANELRLEEESKQLVSDWRAHIIPILRKANKSTFDIHQYGTKILQDGKIGQVKLFKNLADSVEKCEQKRELHRYFVATLQLANMGNIEICGGNKGQIANDSFAFKIVDKEQRDYNDLEGFVEQSQNIGKRKLSSVEVHAKKIQK